MKLSLSSVRVAQRAFRERKQSQLVELQARIKSYEQEDIERNVALQKVAKRLKEENQLLRERNDTLNARVAELEARIQIAQIVPSFSNDFLATDRKRSREISSPTSSHSPIPHAAKRTRDQDYQRHDFDTVVSLSSLECTTTFDRTSPISDVRQEMCGTDFSAQGDASTNLEHNEPLSSFLSCGYCEAGTLCVCREISYPTCMASGISTKSITRAEENGFITSTSPNLQAKSSSERRNEPMILDKPPIYEPAVPIRRRNRGLPTNTISPDNIPEVTCSGDPNDCLACKGDSFGQAFCTAIGSSKCDYCVEIMSGCCSSPLDCPSAVPSLERNIPLAEQVKMMPTNNAWRKLKTHPNVQFADLTLLAEVVARKSICNGPELVISSSHNTSEANHRTPTGTNQGGHSPPSRSVPHGTLLECGRKGLRHVRAEGVQEALRLLDVNFS